jgi:hypothetical protein
MEVETSLLNIKKTIKPARSNCNYYISLNYCDQHCRMTVKVSCFEMSFTGYFLPTLKWQKSAVTSFFSTH